MSHAGTLYTRKTQQPLNELIRGTFDKISSQITVQGNVRGRRKDRTGRVGWMLRHDAQSRLFLVVDVIIIGVTNSDIIIVEEQHLISVLYTLS